MARITVEDCLAKVDNRFKLIHLAAKRVRQLRKGAEPLVVCKNKDVVTSLREIAGGKVLELQREREPDLIEAAEDFAPMQIAEPAQDESPSEESKDDSEAGLDSN